MLFFSFVIEKAQQAEEEEKSNTENVGMVWYNIINKVKYLTNTNIIFNFHKLVSLKISDFSIV